MTLHALAFRTLRRLRYRACLAVLDPAATTLWDVGCSDGRFVALARARGFDARGTDAEVDVASCDGAADIVTCFEVLEHVVDPAAAIRNLARLYRKQLVVTVPNEPWFSLSRLGWASEHLWAVTPQALRHHLGVPAIERTLVARRYYLGVWTRAAGTRS